MNQKKTPLLYRIDILTNRDILLADTASFRVVYVVDGSCRVGDFELRKKDVMTVNHEDDMPIHVGRGAMVVVVSIDRYLLCNEISEAAVSFTMNSLVEAGKKYDRIIEQMKALLYAFVSDGPGYGYRQMGCFYMFLSTMLTDFLEKRENQEGEEFERIGKILNYIHANYRGEISQAEIADELFVSASTVSRLIQKHTGKNFVSYIRDLRLENARKELEETSLAVTRIAVNNGFSSASAFNKAFRDMFGMTPSAYRSEHKTQHVMKKEQEKMIQLREILQKEEEEDALLEGNLDAINADISNLSICSQWKNRLLNVGPAHILRYGNMQDQAFFLAEQLGAEYIRIWNVFSEQMMICKGGGEYNYSFVDEILDICVDHGMKLFFDMAQRKEVAMASMTKEIYSIENQHVFESEEEWVDALDHLLKHISRRYAPEITSEWIFEFSFFLNDRPYYISHDYSAKGVWDQGYEMVKRYFPEARVAGPGLIAGRDRKLTEMILEDFLHSSYQPDLFTIIHFPYFHEERNAETGYRKPSRHVTDRFYLEEQIDFVQSLINKMGYQGEYWITDWGISIANRNYIQDSCFRGTFVLENMLRYGTRVDAMGIFYASDLLNAFLDTASPITGSAGIITRGGICKPVFYAYRFLSRLGKYLVQRTGNCIITANNEADLQIISYNDNALGVNYYLMEENSYRPEELHNLFERLESRKMQITLQRFEEDEMFIVRHWIMNEEKGSVLNKWIQFGCEENLLKNELNYLRRTSLPEIQIERIRSEDGTLRINYEMEPNEIRFISITRT